MDESGAENLAPVTAGPDLDELSRLCDGCGYSLVGLTHTNRCPECGWEFDPDDIPLARIPWLRRPAIGTTRAYWMTVWAVLAAPARLGEEFARPVKLDLPAATNFKRRTTIYATLEMAIGIFVAAFIGEVFSIGRGPIGEITLVTALIAIVAAVGMWVFMSLTFAMPAFLLWPVQETDEYTAAFQYAAAPFLLLPVPFLIAVIANFLSPPTFQGLDAFLTLSFGLPGIAWLILFLRCAAALTKHVSRGTRLSGLMLFIALPIWLGMAGFTACVACAMTGFLLALMIMPFLPK